MHPSLFFVKNFTKSINEDLKKIIFFLFLDHFINFIDYVHVCFTIGMDSVRYTLESISLIKTLGHVFQH